MKNIEPKKRFVQIMLDYTSDINYKIWKRTEGTNAVYFSITNGDAEEIVNEFIKHYPNAKFSNDLPVMKDMKRNDKFDLFDMFIKDVKSLLRTYVKENGLFNDRYQQ